MYYLLRFDFTLYKYLLSDKSQLNIRSLNRLGTKFSTLFEVSIPWSGHRIVAGMDNEKSIYVPVQLNISADKVASNEWKINSEFSLAGAEKVRM